MLRPLAQRKMPSPALRTLRTQPFTDVIRRAVETGEDTDTIASIASRRGRGTPYDYAKLLAKLEERRKSI